MSKIEWAERKKVKFINEYKELCKKHNMMVCMVEIENYEYLTYTVGDIRRDPIQLDKAIDEMMIEDLMKIEKE